jgi:hypothetical protein
MEMNKQELLELEVREILKKYPNLTYAGFDEPVRGDRVAEFINNIVVIAACLKWFEYRTPSTECTRESPAAGTVKHMVEACCDIYISRGATLVAALLKGFPVEQKTDRIGIEK